MLLLALLAALGGGAGPPGERRTAHDAVRALLDTQAAAVHAGDAERYLSHVDPAAPRYRAAQQRAFRNLGALPLAEWSYEITGLRLDGGRAAAEVRLRHRLRGYDRAPRTSVEKLDLVRRDGRWYVAGERRGSARQLWEQGRVTTVRGSRSLVLSTLADRKVLRGVARAADRAVPAVSAAWPRPWPERLVVLVPASVRGMGELLGASADAYAGIAAVTSSQSAGRRASGGGPGRAAPADRVVVNPEAYGLLSREGRQVVMTHETTHVAARSHTTAATPLWLSEGLADWFGYRGTGRPARQAAPELARAVYAERIPRALPTDEDFGFDNGAAVLARAYEGSWLACRMIAERWGERALMTLYTAVGRHADGGPKTTDRALRAVLGVGTREFTAQWRGYLRSELG